MQKAVKAEGDPYSKWTQLIRDGGYSKPVNIEVATVTGAPPNIKIRLDADGLELEKEDLIIAESLTKHIRKVSLSSATVGGSTVTAGTYPHNHGYESVAIQDGLLTYEDELKVGDRVIVACLDEDMVYVVLDRAVWYA